ncbi:MAG TPA: blue light sensor protein [Alphaproteobacteria bacterium]|nr:blue light sensor protein [Alphaproteobacteria bacterium]|tara:strand:+ start:232 stop:651 length:420 start_codon:yes stop_codon:yes gene_type:complete
MDMSASLKRVIYVSERADTTNSDLQEIINSSRVNNPQNDVTGCLVSGINSYLQLLEGPDASVDELYVKISKDTRHTNIVKLNEEAIDSRLFTSWSMRLDPFNNLMWSDEEINAGNFLNITATNALNIFTRIHEQGKSVF